MKLQQPYNSLEVNPQLKDILVPDNKTVNTQPNSINGNFPEYTEEGVRIYDNIKREYILRKA